MNPRRTILGAAGIAMAVVLAVAAIVNLGGEGTDNTVGAETLEGQRGISVSGDGYVTIKPDTAYVDVGVQAVADTVESARSQAADAMTKVIDALKANGVAEADIQTTSFSISPQYDYSTNTPALRGYMVSNTVTAKLKGEPGNIGDNAGKLVDAAAKAAGNLATVNGVRFTLDDQAAAISDARKKAFDAAKTRAAELAKLAGVGLGDVQHITEGSLSVPGPLYYAKAEMAPAADGGTPIQAGELTISTSVSVTWAIN